MMISEFSLAESVTCANESSSQVTIRGVDGDKVPFSSDNRYARQAHVHSDLLLSLCVTVLKFHQKHLETAIKVKRLLTFLE